MKKIKLLISKKIESLKPAVVSEFMTLVNNEAKRNKELVSLSLGIPYYGMPKLLKDKAMELIKEGEMVDTYTSFPGLIELREKLAKRAEDKINIEASYENILITPGSMAALMFSLEAIINPNDEVILIAPYFASYYQQICIAGGKPVIVSLKENRGDKYFLDINDIKKKINKKTKAIIINSPNNPTGKIFSKTELTELAKILDNKKIYIITDEVYDYLTFDKTYFNIASIKSLWPYVIRCCSFSKIFGMTGWRIGYIHADKKLIEKITQIHEETVICTPHISQSLINFALEMNQKEIEENVLNLKSNKLLIEKRLDQLSDLFEYKSPQGGYFIFPKYKLPFSSKEFATKLLYEAHVAVIPGINFGETGEDHVRLSFGVKKENIELAFDKISTWYKNYKKNNHE